MFQNTCSVEDETGRCPNPIQCKGMCPKHYQRTRTHGSPGAVDAVGMTGQRRVVPRVEVPCSACGAPLSRRISDMARNKTGRVFCGDDCRNRLGSKPRRRSTRPCEQCETDFYPTSTEAARFCSNPCKNAHQARNAIRSTCEWCGVEFADSPSSVKWRANRFCSRECMGLGKIKRLAGFEHNGKPAKVDTFGYVQVWEPDHPNAVFKGWIAQHRLVASQMIGRPLTSDDEVHHVNRIKHDNRPENLEVVDGKTHAVLSTHERQGDRDLLAEYIKRFGPINTD